MKIKEARQLAEDEINTDIILMQRNIKELNKVKLEVVEQGDALAPYRFKQINKTLRQDSKRMESMLRSASSLRRNLKIDSAEIKEIFQAPWKPYLHSNHNRWRFGLIVKCNLTYNYNRLYVPVRHIFLPDKEIYRRLDTPKKRERYDFHAEKMSEIADSSWSRSRLSDMPLAAMKYIWDELCSPWDIVEKISAKSAYKCMEKEARSLSACTFDNAGQSSHYFYGAGHNDLCVMVVCGNSSRNNTAVLTLSNICRMKKHMVKTGRWGSYEGIFWASALPGRKMFYFHAFEYGSTLHKHKNRYMRTAWNSLRDNLLESPCGSGDCTVDPKCRVNGFSRPERFVRNRMDI